MGSSGVEKADDDTKKEVVEITSVIAIVSSKIKGYMAMDFMLMVAHVKSFTVEVILDDLVDNVVEVSLN